VNLVSSIFFAVAILGVLLVINGTFNHKYEVSRPSMQGSLESPSVNLSDIQNLKGNIISLQNNDTNNPAWVLSGKWRMVEIPGNNTNTNTNTTAALTHNLKFNASITMTSIDGTYDHRHKLVDFKLSNITFQNRDVIINGTISVVTSGDPSKILGIKIMNLMTIIIDMDKKMVKEHFGNSPMYGKVEVD
jgi:hypothetical protein